MNAKIYFWTPTILPEACIKTMGVSVKENDNPIGFFGTGLKYAIATIMRVGGDIKITTIKDNWRVDRYFYHAPEMIRNKSFDIIHMRTLWADEEKHEQLPFALDYGKNWSAWMALRELYSNTLDENGVSYDSMFGGQPQAPHQYKDGTLITVECDPASELFIQWLTRYKNWLLDTENNKLVWKNDAIEIYEQPNTNFFYRGIRVNSDPIKSAVTYNMMRPLILTEDRTYSVWSFQYSFASDIIGIEDTEVARQILLASGNDTMIEQGLYLNNIHTRGSIQMQEAALSIYRKDPNALSSTAKDSISQYVRKHFFDESYKPARLTPEQNAIYNEALALLHRHGFEFARYKIRWCDGLEAMGVADHNTNTILLNTMLFLNDEAERVVAETLIEEYMHLEYDVTDCTRRFQDQALKMMFWIMRKGRIEHDLKSLTKMLSKLTDQ